LPAIRKTHLVLAHLRPAAGYAESLALRADGLVTEIPLKGLEGKQMGSLNRYLSLLASTT